jgi:hypothetical protein
MSTQNYTIDNGVLSRLKSEYDREVFPSFWENFERYTVERRFICHQEVRNELIARNVKDDEYFKYIDNLGIFADSQTCYSVENQEIVKQLAQKKQNIFDGVVNKVNWADPWLIAMAKNHNLIIITTEKDDPKRDKLPTLARLFDVQCIDKNSFLKQEGWRF